MRIFLLDDYHKMTKPKYSIILTKVCSGVYKYTSDFASPPISHDDFFLLVKDYRDANNDFEAGGGDFKAVYDTNKTAMTKGLDTVKDYVEGLPNLTVDLANLSGFTINKQSLSESKVPNAPVFSHLTRFGGGTMDFTCGALDDAEYYGAILVDGKGLPEGYSFANGILDMPEGMNPRVIYNLLKQRVKTYYKLTNNKEYTIYFYAGNTAGVSPLSTGTTFSASDK
jgi:hypothetical protein